MVRASSLFPGEIRLCGPGARGRTLEGPEGATVSLDATPRPLTERPESPGTRPRLPVPSFQTPLALAAAAARSTRTIGADCALPVSRASVA